MHVLAGVLALLGLTISLVGTEILRQIVSREYDSWAPALARAIIRIAGWLHPPRAREWQADLKYVQSVEQNGLWEALCHLAAAPKLSSLVVLRWIAIDPRRSIRASSSLTPGEACIAQGLGALQEAKQLLLVGAPGTGKTRTALALAREVIRKHISDTRDPAEHPQLLQKHVENLVDSHIRLLQLHPTYSYEEFVGGPRIRDGNVTFEDGLLLRLIDEINSERVPGFEGLPWVLILDELDRADVSRVFGETFSILARGKRVVRPPGDAPHRPSRTITLPDELYVIGTLVDRSGDHVDSAQFRRFPLKQLGFDRTRLMEALQEQWQKTATAVRYPWTRVQAEMELFVSRAALLNEEIASSTHYNARLRDWPRLLLRRHSPSRTP